jgi:cell wall assembly regulator SMI1
MSSIVLAGIAVVIGLVIYDSLKSRTQSSRQKTFTMPEKVSEDLPTVLGRLDATIAEKAPKIHTALRPGLSPDAIRNLEEKGNFALDANLKAVYQWHDGMDAQSGMGFFSIYAFPSLEEVVRSRDGLVKQLASATPVQRAAFEMACSHRKHWFELFPDGAGDGYYVDLLKAKNGGNTAVFYNFSEDGAYRYYPSLANLFAAINEGFAGGVYSDTQEVPSEEVFEQEDVIHLKYGADQ